MKKYKLGEIADFNKSSLSKSDNFEVIDYLDTSSLTENEIAGTQSINRKDAPSRAQRKVFNNTILYSLVRPLLKHYGLLKNPQNNLIVSTGFATIDIKQKMKTKINPAYLYLLLTQSNITEHLGRIAETSVSAYPSLNPSDIQNLIFSFPAIEVQSRIASVLLALDEKIALNKKICAELEAMAKEIYDYWFVQFDFPNDQNQPYKSSGGKMTFNPTLKRPVPANWEVKTINNLCVNFRGVSYNANDLTEKSNSSVLVLRGNNIVGDNLVYDENVAFIPKSFVATEQQIKKHDIIMTMSSGSKEHIGKCTMFQKDSPHTYGAFLTKFTPNGNCVYFVYLSLISDFFKRKIKNICSGTGINNLTNETFDDVFFAFPDTLTLEKFEKKLTPIYEKIGVLNDEREDLKSLRDFLLPLLMNGQVEVK